jgi:hypothetical protein
MAFYTGLGNLGIEDGVGERQIESRVEVKEITTQRDFALIQLLGCIQPC